MHKACGHVRNSESCKAAAEGGNSCKRKWALATVKAVEEREHATHYNLFNKELVTSTLECGFRSIQTSRIGELDARDERP